MARLTGLEPATSGVTGRHSNQLSYNRMNRIRSDAGWQVGSDALRSGQAETKHNRLFLARHVLAHHNAPRLQTNY